MVASRGFFQVVSCRGFLYVMPTRGFSYVVLSRGFLYVVSTWGFLCVMPTRGFLWHAVATGGFCYAVTAGGGFESEGVDQFGSGGGAVDLGRGRAGQRRVGEADGEAVRVSCWAGPGDPIDGDLDLVATFDQCGEASLQSAERGRVGHGTGGEQGAPAIGFSVVPLEHTFAG